MSRRSANTSTSGRHLHLPSHGFPFSDNCSLSPILPRKQEGETPVINGVSQVTTGRRRGTTDIMGPSALGVPGVSLNRFQNMKTKLQHSAALLRSRSPHPKGQRVPATPLWTCLSYGKPQGCLSPGTPAIRPGVRKGQSKPQETASA